MGIIAETVLRKIVRERRIVTPKLKQKSLVHVYNTNLNPIPVRCDKFWSFLVLFCYPRPLHH